jgi:hypothetical protein
MTSTKDTQEATDAVREAFEKWYREIYQTDVSGFWSHANGIYISDSVDDQWDVFQAGYESARQQEAGVDEVKLRGYICEVLADYDPEELYLKDGSLPSINRMMAYLRPYLRTAQPAAAVVDGLILRKGVDGMARVYVQAGERESARQQEAVEQTPPMREAVNLPVVRLNSYAPKLPDECEVELFLDEERISRMRPVKGGFMVKILAANPKRNQIEVEQPQPAALSEEQAVEVMMKAAWNTRNIRYANGEHNSLAEELRAAYRALLTKGAGV